MKQHLHETEGEPPGPQESSGHLSLEFVRRRKWRIVVAVAVSLTMGLLYCALFGPWYESTSQVLVIKKRLETAPISGPNSSQSEPEDYQPVLQTLITSPRVVKQAVVTHRLLSVGTFQGEGPPLKAILKSLVRSLMPTTPAKAPEDALTERIIKRHLAVSAGLRKGQGKSSSTILVVTFRGSQPDDCPKVLNALVASCQDFLRDTYRNADAETLDLITRARDVLQKDLEAKEVAYRDFLQNTPQLWKTKEGNTVHQERLFMIDTKRSALRMRQGEIQATLKAVDDAAKSGHSPRELLAIVSGVPSNQAILAPTLLPQTTPSLAEPWNAGRPARVTLEEELINLRLQDEKLLEVYGPNHPEVQSIRNRMEMVRALITPSSGRAAPAQSAKDEDYVAMKVELLKQELAENQRAEKSLGEQFEQVQKEGRISFANEAQDDAYRKEIERSRLLYESVLQRLREINSARDFGGFETVVIGPPQRGELAIKSYLLVLGLAFLGGVFVGGCWAYWADVADKSFRTPAELRHRLGVPVIGRIPLLPVRNGGGSGSSPGAFRLPFRPARNGDLPESGYNKVRLAPLLCTYYHPDSAEAEAYRTVRTALYCHNHAQQYRVVQITSPRPGDGKTTLAANLAVSIAQSGKRVLLVDADLRNPRLHEVYGLANQVGLTSVLAGEARLEEAVHPSPVNGLVILPSGPLPPNPAELLASQRFQEVLDSLREQYDCVLVDTSALLRVSDPCAIAPRADGILLTVGLARSGRPDAERAREVLDSLEVKVLGVVANGVSSRAGPAW
jgi:capsular exopolysaccharide synthesis family protein